MFIAVLFIITKKPETATCISKSKWVKKNLENPLSKKIKNLLLHTAIWMTLENYTPSEKINSKMLYIILFHLYNFHKMTKL